MRDNGISNFTLLGASFTDSDKGVDGDGVAMVCVVGDGKECAYVIFVEMEIKTTLVGVDVGNIGKVSIGKIVPIGGSDVGIDIVADLISGEGWCSADWSAAT